MLGVRHAGAAHPHTGGGGLAWGSPGKSWTAVVTGTWEADERPRSRNAQPEGREVGRLLGGHRPVMQRDPRCPTLSCPGSQD